LRESYIFDHVRTPRGKGVTGGALHEVTPVQLAAQVIRALKERNRLAAAGIDEVLLGCAIPVGEQGGSLTRIAAILSGFADSVSGLQISRGGASGLEAVAAAAGKIAMGGAELMIAGGVESMSRVPIGSDGAAHGVDPAVTFHTPFLPEGVSADLLATLYGFSREDLDGYGIISRHRADFAWSQGFFSGSIVPVVDMLGTELLGRDEAIGADASAAVFRRLQPAFKSVGGMGFDQIAIQRYPEISRIEHVHTVGTSAAAADGAAAILVGSELAGEQAGLKARARIRACVSVGAEPVLALDGLVPACLKALEIAGMGVPNIDLWEVNEVFAAVPLRLISLLGVPHDRINVNGGAIAMGHPLGATGAMVTGTLLDALERRNFGNGMVACSTAGGATAMMIERV